MTTTVVTPQDIGRRIRAANALLGWKNIELGRALYERTGDETWINHKSAKVSKMLKGQFDPGSTLLALIADIQNQPITWYYEAPGPSPSGGAPNSAMRKLLGSTGQGRLTNIRPLAGKRAVRPIPALPVPDAA